MPGPVFRMAQTALNVQNMAIGRTGGESLDVVDNSTPTGEWLIENYAQAVAWGLSIYRWTFATIVRQLGLLSDPTLIRPLPNLYARPADLVGQIFAYRKTASIDAPKERYVQTADGVCTDCNPCFAEYVRNVPESAWPAAFTEFMVLMLAAGLAAKMSDMKLAAALRQQALGERFDNFGEIGGTLKRAIDEDTINAPQRQLDPWDPGPLVRARYLPTTGGVFFFAGPPTFIDPPA